MVWTLLVSAYIALERSEAADELGRIGAGTPLHRSEPFCGVRNGFMAAALKNEEEQLRGLNNYLPGMEQFSVLMEGYEPQLS